MSFYTCFDWFTKLRLFVNVRRLLYLLLVLYLLVHPCFHHLLVILCHLDYKNKIIFVFLYFYFCKYCIIMISMYLRIDRNFCPVLEEITSIRLYTPCNPRSGVKVCQEIKEQMVTKVR
jgi:hypothetical protein